MHLPHLRGLLLYSLRISISHLAKALAIKPRIIQDKIPIVSFPYQSMLIFISVHDSEWRIHCFTVDGTE
jgi:hypothetical protein